MDSKGKCNGESGGPEGFGASPQGRSSNDARLADSEREMRVPVVVNRLMGQHSEESRPEVLSQPSNAEEWRVSFTI